MRLDEKIDAIEDALGRLLYGVAFLCAQFSTREEVAAVIGAERAQAWENYPAEQLRTMFRCQAVGGSTQKPTSAAKKQQALEMAKLLAQMIQFAPSVVLETTMTLFDGAFDELTLPKDWAKRVKEEAGIALQRGNSEAGTGMPNTGTDTGAEGAMPPAPGGGGMEEVAALIDQLPPQAKIALGNILARGVPVAEAVPEVLRLTSNAGETLQ
jgi:hypothetical protein